MFPLPTVLHVGKPVLLQATGPTDTESLKLCLRHPAGMVMTFKSSFRNSPPPHPTGIIVLGHVQDGGCSYLGSTGSCCIASHYKFAAFVTGGLFSFRLPVLQLQLHVIQANVLQNRVEMLCLKPVGPASSVGFPQQLTQMPSQSLLFLGEKRHQFYQHLLAFGTYGSSSPPAGCLAHLSVYICSSQPPKQSCMKPSLKSVNEPMLLLP